MTGAMRAEILSSLVSVRADVERHVARLDRYRALKAIEQTIADFPGLEDMNRSLSDVRERMQRQIEETREVRALRAVDKIMPDLTEVLAFLAERTDRSEAELDGSPDLAATTSDSDVEVGAIRGGEETAVATVEIFETDVVDLDDRRNPTANPEPELAAASADTESVTAEHSPKPEINASGEFVPATPPDAGTTPSLAYSLAQMMVQAMVPPVMPPPAVQGASAETKDTSDSTDAAGPVSAPSAERAA